MPSILVQVLAVALALAGCTTLGEPKSEDPTEVVAPTPAAGWQTAGEVLGLEQSAAEVGAEPRPVLFSENPDELQQQVGVHCTEGKDARDPGFLASLVAHLYAAGVDPALATEALVKANCAPLADLVRELVAQGGTPALTPVVDRALFLAGPGAEGLIETAASAGMQTDLGGLARTGGIPNATSGRFAMAYFPAGTAGSSLETAPEGRTLYSAATPGYGMYTFILTGKGFSNLAQEDAERYRELLRVIETYVVSGAAGAGRAAPDTHTFLLPVDPTHAGKDLLDRMGPDRAADMRGAFADYLRFRGWGAFAGRLETGAGPFLISSLEPRLIPSGRGERASRLLVDGSGLGPEFMYPLVDAYDRPILQDLQGRAGSFEPVRLRLAGLLEASERARPAPPEAAPAGDRIRVLGAPAPTVRAPQAPPAQDSSATGPVAAN